MSNTNDYQTKSVTKCRFNPVQCLSTTFETLPPTEGSVYFVTDKKKIFLARDGEMIPMCATSGFFYGTKEIVYDNTGIEPDPNVIFNLDEIEGNDIPEPDDLILNNDGCFYRVKIVDENSLETIRLTLQGTGGGGTGNSPSVGGSWNLTILDGKNKSYAFNSDTMTISFKTKFSGDSNENNISSIALRFDGEDDPFYTLYKDIPFNTDYTFDIIDYKDSFSTSKKTVYLYVYDSFGQERSVQLTIQLVELSLTEIENNIITTFSNSYNYKCRISGATSGISEKQIIYSVYNENDLERPVFESVKSLNVFDDDEIQYNLGLNALSSGVYVLKVKALIKIPGAAKDLYSNVLTHKLAYFKEGTTEPLLAVYVPEHIEQFTNVSIDYCVITNEVNKNYSITFSLDGVNKATLNGKSNITNTYNLYFEEKGVYTLSAFVLQLNLMFSTYLDIKSYTGNLPVIDSSRDDLMLYLNPRNKSNDAIDRNEWKSHDGKYTGTLAAFNYGNADGWLIDENGINYLKLTSGANFKMPTFRPFEKDPTKINVLDSKMGSGMTIELDFEINGVLDYDETLISCLSKTEDGQNKVGFYVTGDKISFNSNRTKLVSLNLVEGKRTKVSFVIEPQTGTIDYPMIYSYLNGKLSGASILRDDSFDDGAQRPATLEINSSFAQIKIYGIRFYTSALRDRMILNNYTASLETLEKRQETYDLNNVYDTNGKINYLEVDDSDYDLRIPCMFLTGGYATKEQSKWERADINDTSARLPYGKKDYRMVDVRVKYPKVKDSSNPKDPNLYFKDYKDYEFINKFENNQTMALAYNKRPINGGAIMYAQGTSSMEYPIKNLRLRFKNVENWYTVKPDIAPVEIICMKADYMESSGSHNTGAANLIDGLYEGAGLKTPGQRVFDKENNKIVTCIKGHPCLIFYSPTGEKGSYEYIGKYNLNLDKATPKPFGFNHTDDFGWLEEGDKYYETWYGDKEDEFKEVFVGQEDPDEGGDYWSLGGETEKYVEPEQKINSIHCFEFLDNAVEVCNFLNKYKKKIEDPDNPGEFIPDPAGGTYSFEETWYNTFENEDGDEVPGWTLGFESRYPEDRIGYHDADMLYPLASWLNSLNELRETDPDQANARFKNEYQCYLNKEFLVTYYLITEALLMVDSRVKNLMFATWGKENYDLSNDKYSYYPLKKNASGKWEQDTTKEKVVTNEYIFYPIFYDMDTMLGLDNTGVYRFNYYDEDTNPDLYNGKEVLWTFVRDNLNDEFRIWYSNLEKSLLIPEKTLSYFNNNQANLANEAFYNGDAKYKYINPAREGYYDYLYKQEIAPGSGPYLYAAQGDRSLMREWFINNRFRFLQGKYASDQFRNGDNIDFRWYYPTGDGGNNFIGHTETLTVVPPSEEFKLKSLKTGYSGVKVGKNAPEVFSVRFNGEEQKTIVATGANLANGTEAYILGISILSDVGDLSNKYMQKFVLKSTDIHLKDLTLGNANKYYYNPYWATVADGESPTIDLSGALYLENFNFYNCSTFNNAIDFSNCKAIQKILLTGSGVSGVTLPNGGALKELRLPEKVSELVIKNHQNLTANNFSLGTYDYDTSSSDLKNHKIGFGNGKYINDYSKITKLEVINTPIDTYSIAKSARILEKYCIRNFNWNITEVDTQYCIRYNQNLTPQQIKTYYVYNSETKTYTLWNQNNYPDKDNEFLYEKIDMIDENNKIVCIPILEQLLGKTVCGDSTSHAEALTGNIVINIPGVSVDELEIYNKYKDVYPNVKISYGSNINVSEAYKIKFYYTDKNSLPETGVEGLETHFETLTKGETTLKELTDGYLTNPNKNPTSEKIYTFAGIWTDLNTNNVYYQDGFECTISGAKSFATYKPIADMNLVPWFNESDRLYSVKFYNYNYKINGEDALLISVQTKFKGNLESALISDSEKKIASTYQYRPSDNSIGIHNRYTFKGWIQENDYNNNISNPAIIDLKNTAVSSDMKLFAHYIVEDANKVATDINLFNIQYQGGEYQITIKDEYKKVVGGKITLPSFGLNNKEIEVMGSMGDSTSLITDIYFLDDSKYKKVGKSSCRNMGNLKRVYLPNTIEEIGEEAFYIQSGIGSAASVFEMEVLPSSLVTLGARAFSGRSNISIDILPSTVKTIGTQCFSSCSKVNITDFCNDGLIIGFQAFARAGKVTPINDSKKIITIAPGVTLEKSGSVNKYETFYEGYPNVTSLTISSNATSYTSTTEIESDLFNTIGKISINVV